MAGHPVELRVRAVQAHEAGEGSYATIAMRFAIGEAKNAVHARKLLHNLVRTPRAEHPSAAASLEEGLASEPRTRAVDDERHREPTATEIQQRPRHPPVTARIR
jgi:hypothetical protein